MNLHVIVNPASGSGAGAKVAPRIEERLRALEAPFTLHQTRSPGHGMQLARQCAEAGAERVLSVGGDGTIHDVANGLLRYRGAAPSVAVLPLGTGNDFYRMVGAPKDIDSALQTFLNGAPKLFDVGHAQWSGGDRYFVNLMGLGLDVDIIQQREGVRWLSGIAQYIAAIAKAAARLHFVPVRVSLDGVTVREEPTVLSAITVGPSAAGGFMLSPGATPDDGKLDLCFVGQVNHLQVLRLIPSVLRGSHGRSRLVHLQRFETATIEATDVDPFYFEMDGELMPDAVDRLVVRVVPGALSVLLPSQAS